MDPETAVEREGSGHTEQLSREAAGLWPPGSGACRRGSASGDATLCWTSLLSSLLLPQTGMQHTPLVRFSSTC